MVMMSTFHIALAGNPNVGKSTLFNALTGGNQHVGNWPGKTVARHQGHLQLGDLDVRITDLPGTYSLSAYSMEELIAREFILEERPDAVVAVVDAANLERNLYLLTQLFELELPVLLVLNMCDVAQSRGLKIDPTALSEQLGGLPVVRTIGSDSVGLDALRTAIHHAVGHREQLAAPMLTYGELEPDVQALQSAAEAHPDLVAVYPSRWLAVKLLEQDEAVIAHLEALGPTALLDQAQAIIARTIATHDEDAETLLADSRYTYIGEVLRDVVTRPAQDEDTRSDRIDRVLTHPMYGIPIFLLAMWTVFQFTANVSAPFVDWIDGVIAGPISHAAVWLVALLGLGGTWFESLLLDGIIAGVGGVLVFVPVLMSLYIAMGVLEESGYMSRAAFVMDRGMRTVGLHGKSFLPLVVGFGCTVPAIYATRTLENENDRRLTGFISTFMSCGARLPVYVVFGAAFFGASGGALIFGMYILGIAVALLTAWVMKRTVYRGEAPQPFIMELPPYRVPSARMVGSQMWDKTRGFIENASTVILLMSIVLWLLMAVPVRGGTFTQVEAEDSLYGAISHTIAPVFAPAGFGNWEATGALVTGFIAKEVVVSTMSQTYLSTADEADASDEPPPTLAGDVRFIVGSFGEAATLTAQEMLNILPRTVNLVPFVNIPEFTFTGGGEEESTTALESALRANFSPLAAVAFNVFILLYVPCMTAVAAMNHEFGLRWTLYQVAYTVGVAWVGAVLVYQVGRLLGLGM